MPENPQSPREKHTWRLHHFPESKKFGLFQNRLASMAGLRATDDSSAVPNSRSEWFSEARSKQRDSISIRCRKASAPDIEPMTTVQENTMDSRQWQDVPDPRRLMLT